MYVRRWDRDIDAGGNCQPDIAGLWIVQSQWLQMSPQTPAGTYNFLELGTMHKTPGCKFYYTVYLMPGQPLPQIHFVPGQIGSGEHTFLLARDPGDQNGEWWALIDFNIVWTTNEFAGPNCLGCTGRYGNERQRIVHRHPARLLRPLCRRADHREFFVPWDGYEVNQVDPPHMCGAYITEQLWQVAQNSDTPPCPDN